MDKIQIDQFLNDFDNLIDSYQDEDDDTYHFGLIVYVENSDREKTIDIIDGQQRITTIFILLAVIRDLLQNFLLNDVTLPVARSILGNL